MANSNYTKERAALLFVDPYNDFLSDGGKLWPLVQGIANQVGLLDNLRVITTAIRRAGIQIFIVPHHRWEPGDYESWDHAAGVASGIQNSRRDRATSSSRSTGPRTASPALISIFT